MTVLAGYHPPAVEWNGLTVTDLFCGAGGSSSGLREAGYRVVIAANHWQLAIQSHQINHPETDHSQADFSQVDPRCFPRTHVLWGSPECTNHSIAKGLKRQRQQDQALFEIDGTRPLPDEAANRSRATMWDIPRFAEHHRYMTIILENVVDAYRWDQFEAWQLAMKSLGYRMQFVWLNSMHAHILAKPEGVPSELADMIISALDAAEAWGIDLEAIIQEKLAYNVTRGHRHGGKVV